MNTPWTSSCRWTLRANYSFHWLYQDKTATEVDITTDLPTCCHWRYRTKKLPCAAKVWLAIRSTVLHVATILDPSSSAFQRLYIDTKKIPKDSCMPGIIIHVYRHLWLQMHHTQLWPPPRTNSRDHIPHSSSRTTEPYNPPIIFHGI